MTWTTPAAPFDDTGFRTPAAGDGPTRPDLPGEDLDTLIDQTVRRLLSVLPPRSSTPTVPTVH